MNSPEKKYFLPYQIAWIRDQSRLKIMEKSRQVGITYADAYDSVKKMTYERPLDVWVSSRDDITAREYLNVCKEWALILHIAAQDLGERMIDSKKNLKAQVLEFACGKRIYALSSNPNAIVGKKGHIKLDEFAVRLGQRDLYRWSKPATTWGGTLSIISTHRGTQSVFYEIIRGIRERGNPMGWSHHRVDIHDAIRAGLVEKINEKTGENLSREDFIHRCRSECIDQEQWLQEYCCIPADDSAAFITHEMISACEHADCLKPFDYLRTCPNYLYVGVDVAHRNVRARTVKSVIPFCEGLRRNVLAVNGTKGPMAQPVRARGWAAHTPEALSLFVYQVTGVALIAGPACCASGYVNERAFSLTPRFTSVYSELVPGEANALLCRAPPKMNLRQREEADPEVEATKRPVRELRIRFWQTSSGQAVL